MPHSRLARTDDVEDKYHLEQGASMQFAWEASAAVLHDLHGDPDGGAEHGEVSFDKQERTRGFGYPHRALRWDARVVLGESGWTPVTVTIATSGFYTSAMEYRPNRRRVAHVIAPLQAP